MTNKKGMSAWIWILIILIIIEAGIGIYFWLFGTSPIDSGSILQPPALPD